MIPAKMILLEMIRMILLEMIRNDTGKDVTIETHTSI